MAARQESAQEPRDLGHHWRVHEVDSVADSVKRQWERELAQGCVDFGVRPDTESNGIPFLGKERAFSQSVIEDCISRVETLICFKFL